MTPDLNGRVIIIGGSHAGLQAAQSLRQGGWNGPITVFSEEGALPYQRPDLSKGFLTDDRAEPQVLKGQPFFETNAITLMRQTRVTHLDRAGRQITTDAGDKFSYDYLIMATGAMARTLPVSAANILTLRTAEDARALRPFLAPGKHIVIIGGGFIGLEVAAAARKRGAQATVLEAGSRCLARALPQIVTDYLLQRHKDEGVTIRTNCGATEVLYTADNASGVRLADGTVIECDAIVAGIGCMAASDLAIAAGLDIAAGGIAVDGHLTTSDPAIMAIGDCAAFPAKYAGGLMRLESIQNATDQARHAAAVLLGVPQEPFAAVPWFWSHQYDIRLQMAGFPIPDAPMLLRTDPASGAFSVLHLDAENRLRAAYSVNATADHMAARRLIASGRPLDPAMAANAAIPLLRAEATAA